MNNRVFIILLLSVFIFTAGCKSKKGISKTTLPEVVKPTTTQLLVEKIKTNENTFNYYSAKAKVHYKDHSIDQDVDVAIVMEKDKYIWMNVTALFGIEAARIKITSDSIIILNRLQRKCIIANYTYIKKMTNVDMKLQQLQNIFIGNATFNNDEILSIADTVLSNIILYTFINTQKQTAIYNNTLKLIKNSLEDKSINRQLNIEYPNSYIVGNNAYPSEMNINIRAEKNLECKFKLSNFVFEKKKDVQFNIPGSYEIIKP
jgi:hypothetical protein